jgi:hypothetical protein
MQHSFCTAGSSYATTTMQRGYSLLLGWLTLHFYFYLGGGGLYGSQYTIFYNKQNKRVQASLLRFFGAEKYKQFKFV